MWHHTESGRGESSKSREDWSEAEYFESEPEMFPEFNLTQERDEPEQPELK